MSFNIILTIKPIQSSLAYRHLLREFINKEIKGRFAGSMAGILWALLNPIANIIVYFFIFSLVMRIQLNIKETGTDQFIVYFLSGFFLWLIFSDSLTRSSGILFENANLITKVVFPVELLPAGVIFSSLIINGIGGAVFLIYLAFAGYFHIIWLSLIILIPLYILFISGLSYMLAAICVFFRDTRELLAIILNIWFYATPIIYPASMVPDALNKIMKLNPIGIFLSLYREILLFHSISWDLVIQILIISLISYCIGAWFFMKSRPAFGDVL